MNYVYITICIPMSDEDLTPEYRESIESMNETDLEILLIDTLDQDDYSFSAAHVRKA